jgi:hypothetical protein
VNTMEQSPYVERHEVATSIPPPPVVLDGARVAPVVPVGQHLRTDAVSRFAPDAVVAAVVGLVLVLVGLIAVTRAGLDAPLSDPVVSVAGFRHTAVLGFLEVGFGVLLLLSGALRSRAGALFFGALLGIAGFVAAVQPSSFDHSLAIESSMAWLVTIAGAVVALAALVLPRISRHSTTIAGY